MGRRGRLLMPRVALLAVLAVCLGGWGALTIGGGPNEFPLLETSFFDTFSSINTARWGILESGGTVELVAGNDTLSIDDLGSTSTGAGAYHKTAIDWSVRNQYWTRFVNVDATNDAKLFRIHRGTPSLGATEDALDVLFAFHDNSANGLTIQSGAGATLTVWLDPAGTIPYAFEATPVGTSHSNVVDGDEYQILFETRPHGAADTGPPEFRVLVWHKSDSSLTYGGTERGYKLFTISEWTDSSLLGDTSNLFFVLGDGETDAIDSETRFEWFGWLTYDGGGSNDLPDSAYAYVNTSEASLFPPKYNVAAYYTLADLGTDNDLSFYVPFDRDGLSTNDDVSGLVVERNVPVDPLDELWVSRPSVVHVGATYYMVYDCRSATSRNQVCGATASDPLGPWTKNSNNPMLVFNDVGTDADWKFARIFYDTSEAKPFKLWVGNEQTGFRGIYYSESNTFDASTNGGANDWTAPVLKVGLGAGGQWDDEFASQPTWWKPTEAGGELWYAGFDGTSWQTGCAIPDTPSDIYSSTFTKCAGNPIIAADDAAPLSSLTAALTGRVLFVADTSVLREGQWISIESASGTSNHITQIEAIASGTLAVISYGVGQVASGKDIFAYPGHSYSITAMRQEGACIRQYGTAFRFDDSSESAFAFETCDATPSTATWTPIDEPWGIPLARENDRAFYNENPTFIDGEI